jgi:hypothetical protein
VSGSQVRSLPFLYLCLYSQTKSHPNIQIRSEESCLGRSPRSLWPDPTVLRTISRGRQPWPFWQRMRACRRQWPCCCRGTKSTSPGPQEDTGRVVGTGQGSARVQTGTLGCCMHETDEDRPQGQTGFRNPVHKDQWCPCCPSDPSSRDKG